MNQGTYTMAEDYCPVNGGCKEVNEHHDTLYNKENGIEVRMSNVLLELDRRVQRKDVWAFFLTSLFLITILIGLVAKMWSRTEAIPALIEKSNVSVERSIRTEEKVSALTDNFRVVVKNTEDIKSILIQNGR